MATEGKDETIDRRRALGRIGTAGAVGASAWAAPAVLGHATASAATSDVPPTTTTTTVPDPPVCGGDTAEIYREDFEAPSPDLSMWSSTVSTLAVATTPTGGRRFLGNNAGPYADFRDAGTQLNTEIVALDLVAPPGACTMRLSFDFFRIHSWDGNGAQDSFEARVQGGPTLVQRTTFGHTTQTQSYPDPYPTSNPGRSGEDESDTLGFTYFGNGVYNFFPGVDDNVSTLEIPITPGPFRIEFVVVLDQAARDESWGLDNVVVDCDIVS